MLPGRVQVAVAGQGVVDEGRGRVVLFPVRPCVAAAPLAWWPASSAHDPLTGLDYSGDGSGVATLKVWKVARK